MPCWIETDDHHTNITQGSFTSVFKIFSVYSHHPTCVTCFGRILLCPDNVNTFTKTNSHNNIKFIKSDYKIVFLLVLINYRFFWITDFKYSFYTTEHVVSLMITQVMGCTSWCTISMQQCCLAQRWKTRNPAVLGTFILLFSSVSQLL
jgi:Pyruvate/2-oxoacid:ferredoxin oxidoreductase delta subunit